MAKQGYVIAKSQKIAEYFTSRSPYDNPQWITLDEATVYSTADMASNAAAKLFKKGSFSAHIVSLTELAMPMQSLSPMSSEPVRQINAEPSNNVVANTQTEVCPQCDHNPCTCDEDDPATDNPGDKTLSIDGQNVKIKNESTDNEDDAPSICSNCSGSGEGQHDGTKCGVCNGTGVDKSESDEVYEDWESSKEPTKATPDHEHPIATTLKQHVDEYGLTKTKATIQSLFNANQLSEPLAKRLLAKLSKWSPTQKTYILETGIPSTFTDIKIADPAQVLDVNKDSGNDVASPPTAKIKVPSAVMAALKQALSEFNKCSDPDVTRDDIRSSHCMTVAAAIQTLIDDLNKHTVDGLKWAQIHLTAFMSPISNHIPAVASKYIISGGASNSLKNMYDEKWANKRQLDLD